MGPTEFLQSGGGMIPRHRDLHGNVRCASANVKKSQGSAFHGRTYDDPEVTGGQSWREIMSTIIKDRNIVNRRQLKEFFSKFLTAEDDPPEENDTFPPFYCWAVCCVFVRQSLAS